MIHFCALRIAYKCHANVLSDSLAYDYHIMVYDTSIGNHGTESYLEMAPIKLCIRNLFANVILLVGI